MTRRLASIVLSLAVLSGALTLTAPVARAEELPAAATIYGVNGRAQTYRLSCESRSAVDLAAYWGIDVAETDFFASLPASDNPDEGFVGNVHGRWGNVPPYDYGVHARPVAARLHALGLEATAERGLSWDALRSEIAAGRPAIVWLIGAVWAGSPQTYVAASGATTTVAPFEHTMLLTGYSATTVTLVDAANGRALVVREEDFLTSWAVLENMAVLVRGRLDGAEPAPGTGVSVIPAAPAAPEVDASTGAGAAGDMYVVQPGDRLASIAEQVGATWPELASLNGLVPPYVIYVGQLLRTPAAVDGEGAAVDVATEPSPVGGGHYLVQPGDQLGRIAATLGVDWTEMARLNGIVAPFYVYAGQTLLVPSGASPAPDVPAGTPTGLPEAVTVMPGETLSQIAGRYGLSWPDLAALNGIGYPYYVYAYQVLRLR